jgi:hypothetical protein
VVVNTVGNGTVSKSPDQPAYPHGATVQLTATPAANHHFVGWSGAASGTSNPLPLLVDQAKTVTATFAIDTRTLALSVTGHGAVAKSPDQITYDHGTLVTLTANPEPGHAFLGWSGDASGTTNPLALTMDADKSLTAAFTHAVNLTANGNGTATKSPDQVGYAPGTVVTLTATPAAGHHFTGWFGDASGLTNPLELTVDADKTIVAGFAIDTHPLSVSVVGSGTVSRIPNLPAYDHGTSVTLSAIPLRNRAGSSPRGAAISPAPRARAP